MVPTTFTALLLGAAAGLASLLVAGLCYSAVRQGTRGKKLIGTAAVSAAIVFGWLAAVALLGRADVFAASPERRLPVILLGVGLPVVLGRALLSRWPAFRHLVEGVPQAWLMGVQLYRVLGAIFLLAYAQGLMPGEFALPAGLGDVGVGLAAPLVAYAFTRRGRSAHRVAVTWNLLGIADLVVAVTMGFLTSPTALQQLALGQPNVLISRYPFVLVPTFAVPVSILLHLFSLGRLRRRARTPGPESWREVPYARVLHE